MIIERQGISVWKLEGARPAVQLRAGVQILGSGSRWRGAPRALRCRVIFFARAKNVRDIAKKLTSTPLVNGLPMGEKRKRQDTTRGSRTLKSRAVTPPPLRCEGKRMSRFCAGRCCAVFPLPPRYARGRRAANVFRAILYAHSRSRHTTSTLA